MDDADYIATAQSEVQTYTCSELKFDAYEVKCIIVATRTVVPEPPAA